MTASVAPLLALAAGWSLDRVVSPQAHLADRLSSAALSGIAVTGAWMAILDVAGLAWTPILLSVPALAGLILVLLSGRLSGARVANGSLFGIRPGPWELLALAAVGLRAILVASVPAFGWDFRYIWGLKARVFAAAGGVDLSWLAWKPFELAHLDYPPLWSTLIAAGRVLGAPVASVAAAWGALIALGLGAACWRIARPAGKPAAALAAVAGAWTPVLLAPAIGTSGSGPLAAFLLAMAVAGLAGAAGRTQKFPWTAGVALAALAVAKDEGTAMAVLLALFSLRALPRRWRAPFLVLALLPAAAWQATISLARIPRLPEILVPARMLHRAMELPGAVAGTATPTVVVELAVLTLVFLCPAPRTSRPFRLALGAWLGVATVAYLVSAPDLRWHVATSLERVLAIPLPVSLGLLLTWTFQPTSQALFTENVTAPTPQPDPR